MKRFVGIIMGLALASVFAACDSSNNTPSDQEVIITTDAKDVIGDTKTDVKQDVPRDTTGETAVEETTTEVAPPVDPGQESVEGDTNVPETTPTDTTPEVAKDVTEVTQTDKGSETTGCFDDPVGSCKAEFLCENDCPTGTTGDPCRQECQGKMSSEGQANYQAFISCLQQNCSQAKTQEELNACLNEKCINQYYGCFWGCQYETCGNTVDCIVACPSDATQQDCVNNCWGDSTAQAQMDLQAALDCTRGACPVCSVANPTPAQTTECDTCWNDAANGTCAPKWEACASYGTKKCGEVLDCVNNAADTAAAQACMADGTKTAGTLWNAMIKCATDACTVCSVANPTPAQDTECNTCINTALNSGGACNDKLQACANDQSAQ